MIYVTGDIHGNIDIRKLSKRNWPEGQALTRDDYLVICGDFGLVWDWSKQDLYWLRWLEDKPWTTLWVDGNHENHDLIDTLEVEELFGGRVQRTPGFPHVIHLMRGEVYDLPAGEGATVRAFTMGGARSHDRSWRIEGKTWWAREMPSQDEYDHAVANLERIGFAVDYVFTHDCPSELVDHATFSSLASYRDRGWSEDYDEQKMFLQWVDERLDKDRLKMWYFGHYNDDSLVRDERHALVYQQVVSLGEAPR